ncbi:MAG: hypothetical protein HYV60_04375 [Planctomycetia bacterium]|nr:hypothetical protein [Planctomycetia bacterium]
MLAELLAQAKALRFDVGDDEESEDADDDNQDTGPIQPIELRWQEGRAAILLDWWSDKSIKPWAGSMKERVILRAMLDAIDPAKGAPFDDLQLMTMSQAIACSATFVIATARSSTTSSMANL